LYADISSVLGKVDLDYSYNFSYLNNAEDVNVIEEKEYIKVFSGDVWDNINREALNKIIPLDKNKALVYNNYYSEYLVYRDFEDEIKIVSWENANPDEIEIVGKVEGDELKKQIITLFKGFIQKEKLYNGKFLFVFNQPDFSYQMFVYIDMSKKLIDYLIIPGEIKSRNTTYTSYLIYNTLGLINNPFTVVYRFVYWLYNSGYVLVGPGIKDSEEIKEINLKNEGMNISEFEEYLDKISSSKVYRGDIDILIDGEEFFVDFIYHLFNAEDSINIRTYIFDNDDYAVKIANILKKKSEKVDVKVLMDFLGSVGAGQTLPASKMPLDFVMPKRMDKYLEKGSKVKARNAKNPWFTTDHVKTFVLDNKIAYIGGMNIGREYRYEWHDMMLRLEGPVVAKLNKEFYKAWAHEGLGGDFAYFFSRLFRKENSEIPDKEEYSDIRILQTTTNRAEIHNAVLEGIKRAKGYIYIENAYFTDNRVINELIKARARGVDVRIILPYWGNHNIINASNIITANYFVRNGIRVFLYPGMTHVKATVIDGWAMIGTANYDKLSMRVNREINVAFSDKEKVEELLERLFEKDFIKSMEVKGEFPIPWYNYILEKIANQL
jgi:cardiolipin synthase